MGSLMKRKKAVKLKYTSGKDLKIILELKKASVRLLKESTHLIGAIHRNSCKILLFYCKTNVSSKVIVPLLSTTYQKNGN